METQLPIDPGDVVCRINGRTRTDAEGRAHRFYLRVSPEATFSARDSDQSGYLTSIPVMPIRPTRPHRIPPLKTSAVASWKYPSTPPSRIFEISRPAEAFMSKQKKSVQFRADLIGISNKISEFLTKQGIHAKVSIDLFTDPEYPDWTEAKIRINTPSAKLAKMYDLYDDILGYSLGGVRKRVLKKLMISIEKAP